MKDARPYRRRAARGVHGEGRARSSSSWSARSRRILGVELRARRPCTRSRTAHLQHARHLFGGRLARENRVSLAPARPASRPSGALRLLPARGWRDTLSRATACSRARHRGLRRLPRCRMRGAGRSACSPSCRASEITDPDLCESLLKIFAVRAARAARPRRRCGASEASYRAIFEAPRTRSSCTTGTRRDPRRQPQGLRQLRLHARRSSGACSAWDLSSGEALYDRDAGLHGLRRARARRCASNGTGATRTAACTGTR
jgi:hypothetical protein